MKPTLFLRSAAGLTLLLGVGHMIGKPWTPSKDPQAVTVVAAMTSHRMHVMGFDQTILSGIYLFTVPLVLSGIVALCLGVAVVQEIE